LGAEFGALTPAESAGTALPPLAPPLLARPVLTAASDAGY